MHQFGGLDFFQTKHYRKNLKFKVCMHIFVIVQRKFKSLFNWPGLWKHGLMNFEKHQNLLDLYVTPNLKTLSKGHALVLKMHQDVGIINQVVHNLELFYDLEVMLRFSCIMFMLEGLNELTKFSQSW
jgi:hypothetical protein